MRRNVFQIIPGIVFAALAVGTGGCSGPRHFDVTGQVKYNGSPLNKPGGEIVFVGPNGTQVPASISEDGTYRATKVESGLNRIAVYYRNPQAQGGKRAPSRPKKGQPPPAPPASPFLTPSRYASVSTSELSVQVAEGTVFNTDLTGPPIR